MPLLVNYAWIFIKVRERYLMQIWQWFRFGNVPSTEMWNTGLFTSKLEYWHTWKLFEQCDKEITSCFHDGTTIKQVTFVTTKELWKHSSSLTRLHLNKSNVSLFDLQSHHSFLSSQYLILLTEGINIMDQGSSQHIDTNIVEPSDGSQLLRSISTACLYESILSNK